MEKSEKYMGYYSLVDDYLAKMIFIPTINRSAHVITPNKTLQFQAGDVLGFYVESHGSNDSNYDNGVVVLNTSNHTNELIWYGKIDDTAVQPSKSSSYLVGTNGVLNSSTHAAPVISISVITTSCIASTYSVLAPCSASSSTLPTSSIATTCEGNDAIKRSLIAGVVPAVLVVVSTISIVVLITVKTYHSKQKQADTGMTLSNQVYCELTIITIKSMIVAISS